MANRNRSCDSSRAQTPPVPPYSLAVPRRSLKVGALLSDYRLRPFSFSRGLHAGILLLAYIHSLTQYSIITPSPAGRKKKSVDSFGQTRLISIFRHSNTWLHAHTAVLHQRGNIIRPALRQESVLDLDRYRVTLRPLLKPDVQSADQLMANAL
jgi:hypothetical protein